MPKARNCRTRRKRCVICGRMQNMMPKQKVCRLSYTKQCWKDYLSELWTRNPKRAEIVKKAAESSAIARRQKHDSIVKDLTPEQAYERGYNKGYCAGYKRRVFLEGQS